MYFKVLETCFSVETATCLFCYMSNLKLKIVNNGNRRLIFTLFEFLENIKLDSAQISGIQTRLGVVEENGTVLKTANAANEIQVQKINERIDKIKNVKVHEELANDVKFCKSLLEVTIPEINKNLIRSNNNSSVIKDIIISGFPFVKLDEEQLTELAFVISVFSLVLRNW